ncbi:SLATT domain-containing protein [Pelagerythrobacter rhizovicinus]|uniref:SLATT domain-containing protein n=2 Tax=Pelagerythrobacter rhizovicinus TaxID=2268576 RepID=A0A4Q2KGP6_9SPHN|nr:SLATT domain-containing protein [Pelagerythrobacter rhizovicinus]
MEIAVRIGDWFDAVSASAGHRARADRAAMLAEARKLAVDVLYSEKGHFAAASAWRRRNYWLGIPAALIGAAAGATILASADPVVSGILALAGAAITALMTFLNPSERAAQHQRAGVAYAQLRRKVRQFAQIDMAGMESAALRATLTALTEEVGSTQGEALAIPSAAYRAAMKSIESGSADYTDQELDAATGRVGAQSST